MADNYVGISIKATDGAKPELDDLKLKLDELKDRVATARADVSTAEADAKLTDLEAKLEAASKKVASPRIDVAGAARANAQITAVEAEMDKLDATAEKSAAVQQESAGGMAAAGGKVKMAFLGVAIGAGLAVKGAADFQAQTVRLVTSAGESAKNLGMVQQGMLGISAQTATSTSEMASGMYTVESAGFHGAAGLQVLKAAAQGAKDEGAQLSTVANGVTDALVDFHLPASAAANVTSQLIAAVSRGKTNFEEFSGSMSNVLPLAAAMRLKLADVSGVLAEMTAHGMSAQRASEDEANAMRELMKPNAAMVKEFTALGISSDEVYKKLGTAGLGGTMQWLSGIAQDGAGKIGQNYTQALGKLMGSAAGLQTALMTTGENAGATNKAIAGIGAASADAKGNVDGFSQVSGTAAFKMQAATESIKAAGISLGSALLPAVTAVLGPITSMLQLIASNKVAADAFALVVGGVLAGALGGKLVGALRDMKSGIEGVGSGAQWLIGKLTAATAAQEAQTVATEAGTVAQGELDVAMDANPIGLIVMAIAALIAVIILAVTHTHQIAHAFDVMRHDVAAAVDWVVNFVRSHWQLLLEILLGPLGLAVVGIVQHWNTIKSDATRIIGDVVNWIKSHWQLLLGILTGPVGLAVLAVAKYWNTIKSDATKVITDVVNWIRQHWALLIEIFGGPVAAVVTLLATHWNQIKSGAQSVISSVVSFFEQLPGKILRALGDPGSLLLNAGRAIIGGLINGLESSLGSLGSFLGGVGSFIASHKGPIDVDRKLLVPHGHAMIAGLIDGISGHLPVLRGALAEVSGTVSLGVPHASPLAAGAVSPAGGVQKIQLEFTGNGSDALFKWIREQVRIKGGNVQAVLGTG